MMRVSYGHGGAGGLVEVTLGRVNEEVLTSVSDYVRYCAHCVMRTSCCLSAFVAFC